MNPLEEFGTLEADVAGAVALAETSSAQAPKVIGKAVYLEMPNNSGSQTTQILITPEGVDENGKSVHMALVYRTVSDWSPRKQWRVSFIRKSADPLTPEGQSEYMTKQVARWLERQVSYGASTIRQTPIVVEITNIDLAEVSEWKAPQATLRRITKARTALSFPTNLYTVS